MNLWQHLPYSMRKVFEDGETGTIQETPKSQDKIFDRVYNFVIGNNRTASLAACQYLKSQQINTILLTSTIEGEARCVGTLLASIANEIIVSHNPSDKPVAIIVGGETTVKVAGNGLGGRNQELVLAAVFSHKE